jgi:hypothetical protein
MFKQEALLKIKSDKLGGYHGDVQNAKMARIHQELLYLPNNLVY